VIGTKLIVPVQSHYIPLVLKKHGQRAGMGILERVAARKWILLKIDVTAIACDDSVVIILVFVKKFCPKKKRYEVA
jgi:hypothetical protein